MANPNPRTDQIEPFQFKTGKEQAKTARKGGIASGKAKRKKASLMKCAQRVLESDIPKEFKGQMRKLVGDVEDENDTLFTMAVASMAREAIKGNPKAFHELLSIVGDLESAYVEGDEEEDELSKSLRELGESL